MEKLHMNSKYKKTTQTYRFPNDKIHEYKLEYISQVHGSKNQQILITVINIF